MYKTKLISAVTAITILMTGVAKADIQDLQKPEYRKELSYYMGISLAQNIKQQLANEKDIIQYDNNKLIEGFTAELNSTHKFTEQQIQNKLKGFADNLAEAYKIKLAENAKKEEQAGKNFREQYAKDKDVQKTASGILYKIKKPGTGDVVKNTDSVKVTYQGSLVNGKIFDESKTSDGIVISLKGVIKGWIEAIPLIKKGGEIEFVLPPELAYGATGAGNSVIPPQATLIFKVKLLDIVNPKK